MDNKLPTDTEIDIKNIPAKARGTIFNRISSLPLKVIAVGLVVVFITIAGFVLLTRGSGTTIQERIDQAYQKGDYETAEQIVNDALERDENDPTLNAAKINLYSLQGNSNGTETDYFQKSKPYIEKALANGGDKNADILNSVGYAYETAGDYEKALEYYTKAAEISPNSAEAWFHKGHALEFLGRGEEALASYNKAQEIDPSYPLLLLRRGNLYLSTGDFENATAELEKILSSDKATDNIKTNTLVSLSTIKKSQLDIPGALELSSQAVEVSPNDSRALGVHGYNLGLSGKKAEGIEFLKKAIQTNPRISWNYNVIGEIYRADKQYNEAIQSHKDAVSKTDNDNTILSPQAKIETKGFHTYNLAKTYAMSGLEVDIVPLIEEALSLNPRVVESLKLDNSRTQIYSKYSSDSRFTSLIR